MNQIKELLDCFREAAVYPGKTVYEYCARTGKKAVGYLLVYAPEEIPHAAGMLPVGIWGGETVLRLAPSVLPSFACSFTQSAAEFQLRDIYDSLAAMIVSSPCGGLNTADQKWRGSVPCIPFVHDRNGASVEGVRREYQNIRTRLEGICGAAIPDEAIRSSILVYNEHRRIMREFAHLAACHPECVNPTDRHMVMKSALFMRKENHSSLVNALNKLLAKEEMVWNGVKVVLSGMMLEPLSVMDILRQNQIAVAADDLAQESRQYRVDAPEAADPLDSLARQWCAMYGCSLDTDPNKLRFSLLKDLVEQHKADGIIFCVMKCGEPEESGYPAMKAYMEKNNIPLLQIEFDQQTQSVEQIRRKVKNFAETLRARRQGWLEAGRPEPGQGGERDVFSGRP
jgi:benzoyl-CoA reductase/2-hydroxyglutaryl-CoA dehydratase subunit BcrC/BadD/HgdB